MRAKIVGKLRAAKALGQFASRLRNWREVWAAYRVREAIPPLVLRSGLVLSHDPADDPILLFREIFVERVYTRGGFYRPRPGDTIVDLGANIGFFAMATAWAEPRAVVHAFEPGEQTRARLERNVEANACASRVTVHRYAVSDAAKTVLLKRAGPTGHQSLFDRDEPATEAEQSAEALSLPQALERAGVESVDFLKIDVEGSEIEIVDGTSADAWRRIRRVAVEYHDMFRPGCRARVTQVLRENGFTRLEDRPEPGVPGLGLIRASR